MATLSGNKVKDTYSSLLKLESNTVTGTLKDVEDGAGTASALKLSTDTVEVNGTLSFTSSPPTDSAELTALLIDGSNNVVIRELDTSAFASGAVNAFETISVSGQTDVVADSSTDTLTLAAGTGIDITTNAATDTITIANDAYGFKTISVSGQTDVVADAVEDTLTFVAGTGITITTSPSTDEVTITSSAGTGTPMMSIRPGSSTALTSTYAIPTTASIDNTSDTGSHEVNNTGGELSLSSNKGIKVEEAGLLRIDISLMLEVTSSNTSIEISVGRERPDGATYTALQEIERDKSTSGNTAIGYTLFTPGRVDDVYIYKIKASTGSATLLQTSTFTVTKLE